MEKKDALNKIIIKLEKRINPSKFKRSRIVKYRNRKNPKTKKKE
jgi:hypothetical protein